MGAWALGLSLALSGGELRSVVITDSSWTPPGWTPAQQDLFGGRPTSRGDKTRMVALKYSYFVVEYSLQRKNPVWVAHVDTKDSIAAADRRVKSADVRWDRGQYGFRPDPNVVTLARKYRLDWVEDRDFTKTISDEIASERRTFDFLRDPRRITRGHMASNNEMKGHGDDNAGVISQEESFSLANVCPQQMGNNSPLWSGIEDDCGRLAEKYQAVAVITGPVFRSKDRRVHYTDSSAADAVKIPIPSHFFKIVIVEIGGKREALGFLVPHDATFTKEDRFKFVESVRAIESFAGIDVMPKLGRNDEVEKKVSDQLLTFLKSN